ncbi:hypothetical protein WJX74_009980 [Apatococcus lobatus]|uniref:RING-type domain-containing protein n=1 Tax=Apatococcus lobatus TaxID=904363 RepID=A0AAW1QWC1_9CHLO
MTPTLMRGLYTESDVDLRKLKKLIVDRKLAPCWPGKPEDCPEGAGEECPICMLHYPSTNKARCCGKPICTECFLQVKSPPGLGTVLCPYCKVEFSVVYKGLKSAAEKHRDRLERQKALENTIRAQQAERVHSGCKLQAWQDAQAAAHQQVARHRAQQQVPHQYDEAFLHSVPREFQAPPAPQQGYIQTSMALQGSPAVQLDSHLAEYVPNDILSTAEGISYDLDVNELMLMQGIYASMSTLDAQAIQDAGQIAQNGSFSQIMNSSPQLHASPSHPRLIVTGQQRGGRMLMDPPADLLQSVHAMDILSTIGMRDAGFLDAARAQSQPTPPPPQQQLPPQVPPRRVHMHPSLAPQARPREVSQASERPYERPYEAPLPVTSSMPVPQRPPPIMLPTIRHGRISSTSSSPGSSPVVVAQRPAAQSHDRQAFTGRTYDPRLLTSIDEIAIFDSRSDPIEYRSPADPLFQGGPNALHGTLSTVSSTSMEQLLAAAEQLGSPEPPAAAHLEPPNTASPQRVQGVRSAMVTRPDARQQFVSWPHTALKEAMAHGHNMQITTADADTIGRIAAAAAADPAEAESVQAAAPQLRKAPAWAPARRRMCAWGNDSATSPGQLRQGRLQLDDDETHLAGGSPSKPSLANPEPFPAFLPPISMPTATPSNFHYTSAPVHYTPAPVHYIVGQALLDITFTDDPSLQPHASSGGPSQAPGSLTPLQGSYESLVDALSELRLDSTACSSDSTAGSPDIAVVLQNPDGTTALVLLTSDATRRTQAQQAALKQQYGCCVDLSTYEAPTTEEDRQIKAAIARADERVQQVYRSSIASNATQTSTTTAGSPAAQDSWLLRMRQADAALAQSIGAKDICKT